MQLSGDPSTTTFALAGGSEPYMAVTVAVPAEFPVTTPAPLTKATLVPETSVSDQVTFWPMGSVLPSDHFPMTVYWWVEPGASKNLLGATAID